MTQLDLFSSDDMLAESPNHSTLVDLCNCFPVVIHRGFYMSAHVLLNLLNQLRKISFPQRV